MPFITAIIFGALASCLALIFEFIFFSPVSLLNQPMAFSFAAALSLLGLAGLEEASKYLFLRQYALQFHKGVVPRLRDILLLGILFGSGFSLLEILLSLQNGLPMPLFPLIGRALLHIGTSLILASFIFRPAGTTFTLKALRLVLAVALIHFLYNSVLFFIA